jgi:hypothetical protein
MKTSSKTKNSYFITEWISDQVLCKISTHSSVDKVKQQCSHIAVLLRTEE